MSSSVEKIKERLSIVDVISSYIQVEQSGKNFKAKCPFHNEKTPSFFISTDRNSYYCFGCGEKGDIFSFVEKFEGTDFLGSLKLLAERAGIKLESRNRNDKEVDKKELYYEILEEATKLFEANFNNEPSARVYLLNRGITNATIKSFRIGYAKDEWRSTCDYLISKGYKKEDLEIVGLIKKSESGYYDRFRGRIIFPLSDSSGRVIAFSGRVFSTPSQIEKTQPVSEAKYLNSPDTPLFNKSNVLFGIDKAKASIRKNGYSIIVEGQMDLVLSHQVGLSNTVAVSGTAFTDNTIDNESKINNLGLIRRLSSKIIFAYDGDTAGIRAASKSAMIALSLDMQVKIANLPEGKDPADIIKENPKQWEGIIKNAVDIVTFHTDRICKSTNDIRVRGKLVREIIFPFLSMINNSTDKYSYLSTVCSKTGLKSNITTEDFEIYNKGHNTQNTSGNKNNNPLKKDELLSRRDNLEKRLFGIIHWQSKQDIGINIETIFSLLEERIGKEEFTIIRESKEPFKDTLAFEAEMWYGEKIKDLTRDVEEIMLSLEEEILNERLIVLLDKINQKGNGKDDFDPAPILVDYQKVVERIEKIKSYRFQ
jgi:DNA primase